MDKKAELIYAWSNQLTAENKKELDVDLVITEEKEIDRIRKMYYPPKSIQRLFFKLPRIQRGLIGIIGLQGVGKTHAAKALILECYNLDKAAHHILWKPLEKLYYDFEFTPIYYENKLFSQVQKIKSKRWLKRWLKKNFNRDVTIIDRKSWAGASAIAQGIKDPDEKIREELRRIEISHLENLFSKTQLKEFKHGFH